MSKWARHLYQPVLPLGEDGKRVTGSIEHITLSRQGAVEGMVLLKNNNNVLPLTKGSKVALFGKASIDYVKGGGGSGDVTVAYVRNLYEGMKIKEQEGKVTLYHELSDFYERNVKEQYDEGIVPGMTLEPDLPDELLEGAANFADYAVISICRFSGEAWDRKVSLEHDDSLWDDQLQNAKRQALVFPDGDYCLAPLEKVMIDKVKSKFRNVIVVLNIGGVIETGWIKNDDNISSALVSWQGGIEGGLATADLLVGDETPSGKLADTFAASLEDYPSSYNFHESLNYAEYTDDIYIGYRYFETIPDAYKKVIYPFGYGLSYTEFDINPIGFEVKDNEICIDVSVINKGNFAGKEVVQVYFSAPNGKLGKPSKVLAGFKKTDALKPGDMQTVTISFGIDRLASYDDEGKVKESSWLLEKGTYEFYVGNSVRNVEKISDTYIADEDIVIKKLSRMLAPSDLKERMLPDGTFEEARRFPIKFKDSIFPRKTLKESEGVAPCERGRGLHYIMESKDIMFIDVAEGRSTLDDFMKQLSDEELIHLLGGQRNVGVSNTYGVGNMPEYGVPEITTADGPAGLRILPRVGICTTAWPCATMLACSFNTELAENIGRATAREIKENNIGIWLAPAVNIHRTPMCGRNFEYYSEDPLVAGRIGAAVVKGVQSQRIAATVKHFAFNNKESNRKHSDSRVSERAAREIYLKAFEIIVNEADPWCIMTSYNKVNGVHCSENEELINGILRGEWGFKGMVMTDWWTAGEHYLEAKAGNDLKMANGYPESVMEALEKGEITHDEVYAAAKNILNMILKME